MLLVKHAIAIVLLLAVVHPVVVGQNRPRSNPPRFRWSSRDAEELSYKHALTTASDLDGAEKAALGDAVAALLRPFKAELEIGSERELRAVVAKTRVKLIDLNGDGAAEVFAQANDFKAGCGATGNCPFWVFAKSEHSYRLLLDSRGGQAIGGIEVFRVEPTRTNGFSDLVLGTHDSASERTLYVYHYDGRRYRRSECYNANWLSTEGGSWHVLKNPLITVCGR
jgi:hypothetical protein